MSDAWQLRHIDLRDGEPRVEVSDSTVYVQFWWGPVPLGARTFRSEELPVGRDPLLALTARWTAEQFVCREAALSSVPDVDAEGRLKLEPALSAVRQWADVADALERLALPARGPANQLSVIVCTRDRTQVLGHCLRALSTQHHPAGEIVVVDNSASGSARATCEAFRGVRWLHEPRPGLSVARNTGLAACTRELVAFTDDDTEARSNWTSELVRAFESVPEADAVTGLVIPADLETPAQRFFQFTIGGLGSQCLPVRFDSRFYTKTLPVAVPAWRIGAGANMAFRRSVFDRLGGFDERLGAGASGCSEDSELWYRLLATGGCCLYEPRVAVEHHHRADWGSLIDQQHAYIRGHVSALIAQYDMHGHRGNLRRICCQIPCSLLRGVRKAVRLRSGPDTRVLLAQITGYLAGLTYLVRPRWRRQRPCAVPAASGD